MMSYKVLQLLFFVSSMTSQVIGMVSRKAPEIVSSMRSLVRGGISKEINIKPLYEVYKKSKAYGSPEGGCIFKIAFNADNTRALISSEYGGCSCCDTGNGIAYIWDIETGKILKELKGHRDFITSVALSADGTRGLTGSTDKTAIVWNVSTGELITTLQVGSDVTSVALSADGKIALTGSDDHIARLYNTRTGKLLKELKGHKKNISSVELSADGKIALTGSSWDNTARIWNTLTGKLLKTIQVDSFNGSVALSADGAIALTGTIDSKVLVWDVKSGTLLNTLLTNSSSIFSVALALSKDGKRALVDTDNGKIQVWNTKPLPGKKETNTPLTVLESRGRPFTAVVFGDAVLITTDSDDDTAPLIDTALIWKPLALEPRT